MARVFVRLFFFCACLFVRFRVYCCCGGLFFFPFSCGVRRVLSAFGLCGFSCRLPRGCFWLRRPAFFSWSWRLRGCCWFSPPGLRCGLRGFVCRFAPGGLPWLRGCCVWRPVVGVCPCFARVCPGCRAVWCAAGGCWLSVCRAGCVPCGRRVVGLACAVLCWSGSWVCVPCAPRSGCSSPCFRRLLRSWLAASRAARAPCCSSCVRLAGVGPRLGRCLRLCCVLFACGWWWLGFFARPSFGAFLSVLWPVGCLCLSSGCWLRFPALAFVARLACGGAVACAFRSALPALCLSAASSSCASSRFLACSGCLRAAFLLRARARPECERIGWAFGRSGAFLGAPLRSLSPCMVVGGSSFRSLPASRITGRRRLRRRCAE